MKKQDLVVKLNEIYNKFEDVLDEPLSNAVKRLRNITDSFGELIQELEDEPSEEEKVEEE